MCINCSDDVTYRRLYRLYAPRKSSSARPSGWASRARSLFVRYSDRRTERRGEGAGSRDCHVRRREGERARPSVDPDLGWTTHLVAHWKNKPIWDLFTRWDIAAYLIMLTDTIYRSYFCWKLPPLVTWVEKRNTCIWRPAVRPSAVLRASVRPSVRCFIAETHGGDGRRARTRGALGPSPVLKKTFEWA